MMYKYYNDYPEFANHVFYKSQDQVKKCIKQFDQAMIHSGLVRAPDTGQLDTNNIPNLNLDNLNNQTNGVYRVAEGTYISYLPLVYCFSDTLQTTSPVYIKILFEIGRLRNPIYQNVPVGAKPEYPCALFASIEVGNATDGNSVINTPLLFWSGITYAGGNADYNQKVTTVTQYAYNDSIINYQKEKGLLYLNICPSYKMTNSMSMDVLSNNENEASLIQLLVYRVDEETIGAFGYYEHVTFTNSSQTAVNKYWRYKNKGLAYNDSTSDSFAGIYNTTSSYVNGRIVLQPVTAYNPTKKKMVRNPAVLLGSMSEVGTLTNSTFKVKISDTETHDYFVYSPSDSGFRINSSKTRVALLIYAGVSKND